MAQLTNASFSINGNPVSVYSSFKLRQSIFEHHHFTLVCPAEAIDGKEGLFTSSKEMLGSSFGARIEAVAFDPTASPGRNLLFQGIITGVETSRFSGHHGDVIITGCSPTIILDAGPHCKSWLNRSLKDITEDVLAHFPQNLVQASIKPANNELFGYMVQYRESAWQFLQRITATKGEWLYWDGRNLVIGAPGEDTKTDLLFGSNLKRFNASLETRPTNIKMVGWDFQNSQVYQSQPSGVMEKAGLNLFGEKALRASQTVYNTMPKQWNPQYTLSKGQQDELATLKSAIESAKMVQFSGESGHPGINIGSMVSVSGNNMFTENIEGYGDYLIIGITHFVDATGNYENSFTSVPSGIKVPPVNIPCHPVCETQSAIVTDNHDKQGLGRIRVKFHWMNDGEKSPWIRVASPHGGGAKGHFFIPELKEEVIVGFEGDSATKPYVIGTVYHGRGNNSFSNESNDIKTIQTRSGTKIRMNDAEGSVFIEDPSGNTWLLDGKGNVSVNAPKNFTVIAGENILLKAGKEITNTAGTNIYSVAEQGFVNVQAKTDIENNANNNINHSSGNIALNAKSELNATGGTTVIKGNTTEVNGSVNKLKLP